MAAREQVDILLVEDNQYDEKLTLRALRKHPLRQTRYDDDLKAHPSRVGGRRDKDRPVAAASGRPAQLPQTIGKYGANFVVILDHQHGIPMLEWYWCKNGTCPSGIYFTDAVELVPSVVGTHARRSPFHANVKC